MPPPPANAAASGHQSRDVRDVRDAVVRACARAKPPLELLGDVAREIRRAVPYAGSGWVLTDPGTLLATGILAEEVEPALQRRLVEHELSHDDVNAFASLARRRRPVARLSAATHGDLARSSRHRTLYAPASYGDELRAVFRTGDACWGQMCLARRDDAPAFTDTDVALLSQVAGHVGQALRMSLAVGAGTPGTARTPDIAGTPGIVVLDGEDELHSVNDEAGRWLRELPDEGLALPSVVYAVARRARLLADGAVPGPPASARVRVGTGRYLVVRGTCLDSRVEHPAGVAVVIEPARPVDIAPLVVALGDLTPREREVAQLLLRGTPTADIARSLWISPHTLRGHVKSVFAKLGVRSRPELTALLYGGRDAAGV